MLRDSELLYIESFNIYLFKFIWGGIMEPATKGKVIRESTEQVKAKL
jgi:hypothetical protein